MKFVLHEHDTRPAPNSPRSLGDTHYDLMIDLDGAAALMTWRLADSPIARTTPIRAERIADHRRAYLAYEGEISDNRGRVRRVDAGDCTCAFAPDGSVRLALKGLVLIGEFQIAAGCFCRLV
ncbi:MAG: hypothetical protein JNG88_14010 [Phycisphaerales bacterium]|nr:hypothetical protein [Phycisphaerales bacterium]